MKTKNTFPVTITIDEQDYQFRVRPHAVTNGRYTVEYINEAEPISFQLVRTPIGHWVAGAAYIPSWLAERANDIGKTISSRGQTVNN
jgi:hypothetical protein